MRRVYTALLYLITPLFFLRLAYRGLRARPYWQRWSQRLGFFPARLAQPTLWVHTVSVGEFQGALPLIKTLQQRHPELPLIVTTTTPTGLARVEATFSDQIRMGHLPYDLPDAVARFLTRIRPAVAVIVETELWPNLFHACQRRGIPLLVVNARLSERSLVRYCRVLPLARQTVRSATLIAARGEEDAYRFTELGATPQQLAVTGNIKYDAAVPAHAREHGARLRAQWGAKRLVWIAASTHEGEEVIALQAHALLRQRFPESVLVLVPRHPERFEKVGQLIAAQGWTWTRRSLVQTIDPAVDVYLADTMGEMFLLYAASDVAFVGGSLVPVGGHNMLEPAALGVPALTGPHVFNFDEVQQRMERAGALVQVNDVQTLANAVADWFASPIARRAAGEAGLCCVEQNRGAVERVAELVSRQVVRFLATSASH